MSTAVLFFFSHIEALCMQASVLPLTYIPALMAAITVLLVTTAARMPQNPLQTTLS